jgi:hypothetical protein
VLFSGRKKKEEEEEEEEMKKGERELVVGYNFNITNRFPTRN